MGDTRLTESWSVVCFLITEKKEEGETHGSVVS